MSSKRVLLAEREMPTAWYNLVADLPEPLPPLLHPGTHQLLKPSDMSPIFGPSIIQQEMCADRWVEIPDDVRRVYTIWRPTPLVRATALERELKTPARIYFKDESGSPAGSHKPNTAVAQAYYNKLDGVTHLTTETGAGQWGSSISFASKLFGLHCKVYMVKVSYHQKPYRRSMMHMWGGQVTASPSEETQTGREILKKDPHCPGSLGIAISEAVEAAVKSGAKYTLGSVLNHVILHQTIIGLEVEKQLQLAEDRADVVIGCVGGGTNFGGIAFPFLRHKLTSQSDVRLVAVEPKSCPTISRGQYRYDFGDTAKLTPLCKMYTLGHGFIPPGIHAGGLRYHGMSPLVSFAAHLGLIEAVAFHQTECFEAAQMFACTEGIIPAPESSHAIRAAIIEALRCKETGQEKCIVFNLSGHGLCDLGSYDRYFSGQLEDFEFPQDLLDKALAELPEIL